MKYFQELEKNFAGAGQTHDGEEAINDFQKKMIFALFLLFILNVFFN